MSFESDYTKRYAHAPKHSVQTTIPNNKSKEPALAVASTVTVITSATYLILRFFPQLDEELVSSIFSVLALLIPLITALFTRRLVWSPASVQEIVDEVILSKDVKTEPETTDDKGSKDQDA